MQSAFAPELSLELVNKAVDGARWAGAQQATAEDAGQDMALALLLGKRVESPRKYGKWMAMNASNPNRQKRNTEVAFSVVDERSLQVAGCSVDLSIWLDVEEVCTVFEFNCLHGRFCENQTLQELADQYGVGLHAVARAIKKALLKLKEVME
jgi:hypothetical protein